MLAASRVYPIADLEWRWLSWSVLVTLSAVLIERLEFATGLEFSQCLGYFVLSAAPYELAYHLFARPWRRAVF